MSISVQSSEIGENGEDAMISSKIPTILTDGTLPRFNVFRSGGSN